MNLRYEILKAVSQNPGAPIGEICEAIAADQSKAAQAVRDTAKDKLLSRELDEVSGKAGYRLTDAGKKRLKEGAMKKSLMNLKQAQPAVAQNAGSDRSVAPSGSPSAEAVAVQENPAPGSPSSPPEAGPAAADVTPNLLAHIDYLEILANDARQILSSLIHRDTDTRSMNIAQIAEIVRANYRKWESFAASAKEAEIEISRLRAELARLQSTAPREQADHPDHYQTSGGIECIDAIAEVLGEDGFDAFCRGNALKYLWRAGKKGDALTDMAKAQWYLGRIV